MSPDILLLAGGPIVIIKRYTGKFLPLPARLSIYYLPAHYPVGQPGWSRLQQTIDTPLVAGHDEKKIVGIITTCRGYKGQI